MVDVHIGDSLELEGREVREWDTGREMDGCSINTEAHMYLQPVFTPQCLPPSLSAGIFIHLFDVLQ